ncbi:DUF5799 family protein [Haloglomus halophilum]|uniref:DUF5799 family protein n=1 Tax=Haloglomus halophilum TaxID=2962672 RepID=UPI0020C944FB|nr:DUF5799 family protein [Haloglomus halophilum]
MTDDDPDSTAWSDRIVGARMAVDSEFSSEVDRSVFSRQEWGLVMTAVEFDIESAGDEETAELVANTDSLREVLPELERAREAQAAMAAGRDPDSGGGSGILDSVKGALGLDGDDDVEEIDEDQLREAERLADAYATELQAYLESNGRWEEIRTAYVEQQ